MKNTIPLILVFLLNSCNQYNTEFIDKFETDKSNIYTKKISNKDLSVLLINNEFDFKKEKEYSYGFKEKLNDRYYMLSYEVSYIPTNLIKNMIWNWADIYYCIYDIKNNTVISKLRVSSSDPIFSYTIEKKGTYEVKSYFLNFSSKEDELNKKYNITMEKDSIIQKYTIINNRFKLIKE